MQELGNLGKRRLLDMENVRGIIHSQIGIAFSV
jgi:hypothetical protein